MSEFFLNIVNMSISASWIVLAVLVLRLLLKKSPKWITVLLWGIVAIRLVCPFTVESFLSLIPSAETISPEIMTESAPTIDSGIPIINDVVNSVISESLAPTPGDSVNPLQVWISAASIVWVIGIAVLLFYSVISYFRVKNKIGTAVLLRDNIFQSENVVSPFVLGIIRPKIYLPFNMTEQDMAHVIAHENAHVKRRDHLWKPFGFLLLAVHWFNPLMWLGYILLCKDIELACDEKVIKELNTEQKADYSQALLTCSVQRRMIAACPLAFGEVSVKDRVKSVLSYKKPAFWIVVVAIVTSIAVALCFLTNPLSEKDSNNSEVSSVSSEGTESDEASSEDTTTSVTDVSSSDTGSSETVSSRPVDDDFEVVSVGDMPDESAPVVTTPESQPEPEFDPPINIITSFIGKTSQPETEDELIIGRWKGSKDFSPYFAQDGVTISEARCAVELKINSASINCEVVWSKFESVYAPLLEEYFKEKAEAWAKETGRDVAEYETYFAEENGVTLSEHIYALMEKVVDRGAGYQTYWYTNERFFVLSKATGKLEEVKYEFLNKNTLVDKTNNSVYTRIS